MKVTVSAEYSLQAVSTATLPAGKTWGDVFDFVLKWDTLYIRFSGDSGWIEIDLDYPMNFDLNGIDTKHPGGTEIYATDASGDVAFDDQLS